MTALTAALAGSVIVVSPSSPSADAGTIVPMACPTGSVEVQYGFAPPADGNVTPQVGGLLCQVAFTADGTFTTPAGITSADVLVVGAGGGGGGGGVVGTQILAGGGGAGGQVAVYENVSVTGDISVTVGTGGAGGVDECTPSCSAVGGVDGADGEGSEFGTDGTYAAGGGEGGKGGAPLAASPFMTSGDGGSSPSAPLVSPVPVGVTATVSDGGAGATSAGQLMGPGTQNFYSGGGAGAGAGGAGTDATVSDCITVDGATSCSVSGGDGGIGVVPYTANFSFSFWQSWFPSWSFSQVGQYSLPNVHGFGPGGAGATAGLLIFDPTGGVLLDFGAGTGRNLDLTESNSSGQGAVTTGFADEGSGNPYEVPFNVSAFDEPWSENAYAFGGGGGAASGNTSVLGAPSAGDGSPGVNGLVIVLFLIEAAIDVDGDGFSPDEDCDDERPTVNPEAPEIPGNGLDDDCDSTTPGFSNESYTCVSPDASASVVENGFQQLVFSKAEDLGEPADEGDAFRYLQVGAIGGPTFAAGEITTVSGSGPWTVTVDVSDTSALTIGDAVTSIRGTGRFGNGGVYTITSIVDGDTFELEASADSSSPVTGTVTSIRTGQRVDAMVTVVENDETSIDKLDDWSSTGTSNARIDVESEAFGFSATGTVANITGTGPWTAEITGLESTEGLMAGMRMFADDTIGSIGADGVYVIEEVLSPTSIRYSATGGVAPEEGSINEFALWSGFQLRIDFLAGGTDTPITVDDIALTIRDVDDLQYTEFARPDALRLENDTRLEIFTNDDLDVVPSDSLRVWSANESSSSDPRNWIEVRYFSTDSISLRLGQLRASGANFGLNFVSDTFESPIDCTVNLDLTVETALTYTGDSGVVLAGTPVTLSSVIDPAECTTPGVTYELVYPDGSSQAVTSPLDTTSLLSGIYEIVASYAGDGTCLPSEDRAVLVVTSSADTVTGGGVYHVDSDISGSPRVHFGFTVQKTDKVDRRTGVRTITQRGQLLWINNNEWRLKSALYARWTDSGGVISGDRPVFGTVPCPVGVGASGSNPRCGVIAGGGWLERWNSDTLTWDVATDLGVDGWVSFSATVYDGGKVSVCKGKRNCTIVDVADWFGMAMNGIAADDETGVPVTAPVAVRKQRNGAIVIRS